MSPAQQTIGLSEDYPFVGDDVRVHIDPRMVDLCLNVKLDFFPGSKFLNNVVRHVTHLATSRVRRTCENISL